MRSLGNELLILVDHANEDSVTAKAFVMPILLLLDKVSSCVWCVGCVFLYLVALLLHI